MIIQGDALKVLRSHPAFIGKWVDAIVTDPPAGISFMGKEWDGDKGGRDKWIAWLASVMSEAFRVLKPGGHGLVWALPRTAHWTAFALEQAGFEIRDKVYHLFGTGFPKSHDVSKAIDLELGAEREIIGTQAASGRQLQEMSRPDGEGHNWTGIRYGGPVTPQAKEWDGWGTALKPAAEEWILVRKPLHKGNIAANVMRWRTGGLNIDRCRIPYDGPVKHGARVADGGSYENPCGWVEKGRTPNRPTTPTELGRWPANLMLSHALTCGDDGDCVIACPARLMNEQSGYARPTGPKVTERNGGIWKSGGPKTAKFDPGDGGGASRFFYVAKPSTAERDAGLEELEPAVTDDGRQTPIDNPYLRGETLRRNTHPTVKPVTLMRYLCRLITPPGGVVLDCFAGSGTTGMAARAEGLGFIGIELDPHNAEIARRRTQA